jgi:type 1 glutamine amidotransferase
LETAARPQVLFVGGCRASYHQLEPAEPFVRHVLESLGLGVDVTGIRHPDGDDRTIGDYGALNADTLERYAALVLFTTGRGEGEDIAAMLDFVRRGGALIGIHCAADSFTSDAAYIAALGGKFRTHPAPLDIAVEFVDTDHPVTQGLASFTVRDELYLFSDYDPSRVHLLAQTRSYTGEGLDPIPICWLRDEGKGRVFYLSLGHFPEAMASRDWQALFARGVRWALRQL